MQDHEISLGFLLTLITDPSTIPLQNNPQISGFFVTRYISLIK